MSQFISNGVSEDNPLRQLQDYLREQFRLIEPYWPFLVMYFVSGI